MPIFAAHARLRRAQQWLHARVHQRGQPERGDLRQQRETLAPRPGGRGVFVEASSDEASSSSPRVLATRRAADSSIAAFSRVEAAATDERDESAPRRLPNAVFSSERRNSRPPSEMSTWVSESPEAASACSSSCACSRQYASRASERRREPGVAADADAELVHADDELVRHVEAARSRVSRETRRVGGLVREGLVREGLVRAAVRGAVVVDHRDAHEPASRRRRRRSSGRDREVTSKKNLLVTSAARRRSRRRGGRRGARGEAAARGSARRAYAGRSGQHRPFHCSASGFTGSPSRAIGVTSGNPLI